MYTCTVYCSSIQHSFGDSVSELIERRPSVSQCSIPMALFDSIGFNSISSIVTTSVTVNGTNRPSSKNIYLKAGIQCFEMTGIIDGKLPPSNLISSIIDSG